MRRFAVSVCSKTCSQRVEQQVLDQECAPHRVGCLHLRRGQRVTVDIHSYPDRRVSERVGDDLERHAPRRLRRGRPSCRDRRRMPNVRDPVSSKATTSKDSAKTFYRRALSTVAPVPFTNRSRGPAPCCSKYSSVPVTLTDGKTHCAARLWTSGRRAPTVPTHRRRECGVSTASRTAGCEHGRP